MNYDLRLFFGCSVLSPLLSGQANWSSILSSNTEKMNHILPFLRRVVRSMWTEDPASLGDSIQDGDVFYIPKGGKGAFQGKEGKLAVYKQTSDTFLFYTPYPGFHFVCLDDGLFYIFLENENGDLIPTCTKRI